MEGRKHIEAAVGGCWTIRKKPLRLAAVGSLNWVVVTDNGLAKTKFPSLSWLKGYMKKHL